MAENMERRVIGANAGKKRRKGAYCENLPYSGREAYKRLRTNVMISLSEDSQKKNHVLGITSVQPSEGKSSVAVNLAYSLAELGHSVLLIDGDLRRPSIHEKLGAPQAPGLSDVLTGAENVNTAILRYASSTDNTYFDVLTSGTDTERSAEILHSGRFQKLIDVASEAYDYVIIDMPPVGPVVDAVTVSKFTDGVLFVVREGHCPRNLLTDSVDQLRYAKVKIVGFVMNGSVDGSGKRYQYQNSYSYRNYGK